MAEFGEEEEAPAPAPATEQGTEEGGDSSERRCFGFLLGGVHINKAFCDFTV